MTEEYETKSEIQEEKVKEFKTVVRDLLNTPITEENKIKVTDSVRIICAEADSSVSTFEYLREDEQHTAIKLEKEAEDADAAKEGNPYYEANMCNKKALKLEIISKKWLNFIATTQIKLIKKLINADLEYDSEDSESNKRIDKIEEDIQKITETVENLGQLVEERLSRVAVEEKYDNSVPKINLPESEPEEKEIITQTRDPETHANITEVRVKANELWKNQGISCNRAIKEYLIVYPNATKKEVTDELIKYGRNKHTINVLYYKVKKKNNSENINAEIS